MLIYHERSWDQDQVTSSSTEPGTYSTGYGVTAGTNGRNAAEEFGLIRFVLDLVSTYMVFLYISVYGENRGYLFLYYLKDFKITSSFCFYYLTTSSSCVCLVLHVFKHYY